MKKEKIKSLAKNILGKDYDDEDLRKPLECEIRQDSDRMLKEDSKKYFKSSDIPPFGGKHLKGFLRENDLENNEFLNAYGKHLEKKTKENIGKDFGYNKDTGLFECLREYNQKKEENREELRMIVKALLVGLVTTLSVIALYSLIS